MLTLLGNAGDRDCQGTTRREFLKIGTLGLGGLALPSLLKARAQASAAGGPLKDTSVVFLFLCGGASHIETFDPKMTAPEEIRSATGELKTSIPGVTFGGTFANMARLADKLAVVRSFAPHAISDHKMAIRTVFTAGSTTEASIGATYARLRGATNPKTGMPTFIELISEEVDPEYRQDMERMRRSDGPGNLGATYAPFDPSGDGQINRDMRLNIPLERFNDRLALLNALDRLNRRLDSTGAVKGIDNFGQQAVELILGKTGREALDLSKEDPRLVAKYDTSDYMTGFQKRGPSTLGKRLLLARRLCEAGCGFVTVGSAGWDHHANDKHSGMIDGMKKLGTPLDRAVSTFLEDVHDRGLSDQILLVIITEFGRTPKINKNGGRDHWPGVCTLALAGGGLRMGQVIGESTSKAEEPKSDPIGFDNLVATMFHVLFDMSELRVQRGLPSQIAPLIETAEPIAELV